MPRSNAHAWSEALNGATQDIAVPSWLTHRLAAVVEYADVKFLDAFVDRHLDRDEQILDLFALTDELIITATCGHLREAQNDPKSARKTTVTVRPVSDVSSLSVAGIDRNWTVIDGEDEVFMGLKAFQVSFRDPSAPTLMLPWTTNGRNQWAQAKTIIMGSLKSAAT